MKEIVVSYDLNDVNQLQFTRFLTRRYYGKFISYLGTVVLVAVYACTFLLLVWANGESFFPVGGETWLLPLIAALMITAGLNTYLRKRLTSAVLAAPFRHGPHTLILSSNGCFASRLHPWTHTTDVVDWNGMTLLLISPIEAFPIPHADLPPGLTPEALNQQIAAWRNTAQT